MMHLQCRITITHSVTSKGISPISQSFDGSAEREKDHMVITSRRTVLNSIVSIEPFVTLLLLLLQAHTALRSEFLCLLMHGFS